MSVETGGQAMTTPTVTEIRVGMEVRYNAAFAAEYGRQLPEWLERTGLVEEIGVTKRGVKVALVDWQDYRVPQQEQMRWLEAVPAYDES